MSALGRQDMQQAAELSPPWHLRTALWLESRFRPYLGWGTLLILSLLALLPATMLRVNEWVRLGRDQSVLEILGPLSIMTVWLVAGWRKPREPAGHRIVRAITMASLVILSGCILISQAVTGWIPGVGEFWHAIATGSFSAMTAEMMMDWSRFGARVVLWWTGVATGSATQDNLIFLAIAGTIMWLISALSALIARRLKNGLLAATPLLWLLSAILLYSREGRILFVFALGLALLLHLFIDHETLLAGWQKRGFDYSPGLFVDRLMLALGAMLLILTVAAVMPNVYIDALVTRYYARMQPVYETLEDSADRLFPGVKGVSRLGGGLAGGLPNEFLLRAGPDLTDTVVMRVRTNDAPALEYPYDSAPPPGHYMRGGTLALYDGRGWSNPKSTARQNIEANTPIDVSGGAGRKEIVQQVALSFNTQVLYVAPEPVEVSTDFRLEARAPGDAVALWGREKSYTVVSRVPAVSEEDLRAAPSWDGNNPLPDAYAIHLSLPDTITQRTADLARALTEEEPSMFAKAKAIESYLRTYEYDLDVPAPPKDVVDVADYFLFDLQRGYCDYYATAFVVLARLAGLPSRFATGFVPGQWNPEDGVWTITEAEAHSWPEVYFPKYGWIPFEPTAGRPELVRIGLPQASSAALRSPTGEPAPEPDSEQEMTWNWQMLFWLLPLGFLMWGGLRLAARVRRQNEDPWLALVQWGERNGRPMADGETVLEYGEGLALYLVNSQTQMRDIARIAAKEMRELTAAVSLGHYAPAAIRDNAAMRAAEHWQILREYLRTLRKGLRHTHAAARNLPTDGP